MDNIHTQAVMGSEDKTKQLWERYSMKNIQKFEAWIAKNKLVYTLFVRYAKQYRNAGFDRCSATLIGNRIRWETAVKTVGSQYKISNNYLPMLARKLACEDSSFLSFFVFQK